MNYLTKPLTVPGRIFIPALFLPLAILSFLLPALAFRAQDKMLIWRSESPCHGFDCLEEKFLLWPDNLREGDGTVFVRVCSERHLLSAFANAALNPIEISNWVRTYYNFKPDQIMFVRDNRCTGKKAGLAATEIWWAPSNVSGPEWVDGITAAQLKVSYLGKPPLEDREFSFEGPTDYRAAVRELIGELQLHPTAFGQVAGYYLEHPTREMMRAINESSAILKRSGIKSNRFESSLRSWPGGWTISPPDPKPNRPTVILYDVDGDIVRSSLRTQ